VLEYLVRHAGAVVERGSCSSTVGLNFEGDPNIVEVYVGRLRRKMTSRSGETIETIRGRGLSMDADA